MSDNKPLLVCATYGMRDHGGYAEEEVANLPIFFEFKKNDHDRFDILKGLLEYLKDVIFQILIIFLSQVASSS